MIPSKVSCDGIYIPAALHQDTLKLYFNSVIITVAQKKK